MSREEIQSDDQAQPYEGAIDGWHCDDCQAKEGSYEEVRQGIRARSGDAQVEVEARRRGVGMEEDHQPLSVPIGVANFGAVRRRRREENQGAVAALAGTAHILLASHGVRDPTHESRRQEEDLDDRGPKVLRAHQDGRDLQRTLEETAATGRHSVGQGPHVAFGEGIQRSLHAQATAVDQSEAVMANDLDEGRRDRYGAVEARCVCPP